MQHGRAKSGGGAMAELRRVSERAPLPGACAVLLFFVWGCVPPAPPAAIDAPPLTLLGTEQLDPPSVGLTASVFRPSHHIALDDESGERAVGFYINVASARPESLELEFVAPANHKRLAVSRIARPADDASLKPVIPDVEARARLLRGEPLFWREQGAGLQVRLGVLLPERLLGSFSSVHVLDTRDSAGNPVHFVHVDLAREFFYAAVLGDSITWGNGLREQDKFTTRVIAQVEQHSGMTPVVQCFAQSGAFITRSPLDRRCEFGCLGEVPTADFSILHQVESVERPELVRLVILDGCINDLSFGRIIDPETDENELSQLTQYFCEDLMRELLRAARARMPNAWIVVAGYYPIVSPDSDLFSIAQYTATQLTFGPGRGRVDVTAEQLADARAFRDQSALQSALFHSESAAAMQRAVAAVQAENEAAPPVLFVDPAFEPENSVFATRSFLWATTAHTPLLEQLSEILRPSTNIFPEDDTLGLRLSRCVQPDAIDGPFFCLYVSVGHPNVAGAARYTERILESLNVAGFFAE